MHCTNCGNELKEDEKFCTKCGKSVSEKTIDFNSAKNSDKLQIASFVGPLLLLIGSFIPLVDVDMYGTINYFNDGRGDGVIIVVIALTSFAFAYLKKYKFLFFAGIASLAMLIFTFVLMQSKMQEIGSFASDFVNYKFGWLFLLAGSGLMIWSGYQGKKTQF